MVTHYHGDIRVDWDDGEWERLQKIKRGDYVPVPERQCGTGAILFNVPLWLRERVHEYAKHKGVTSSELLRQAVYILTQ